MKVNIVTKLMVYAGSISIQRTWRDKGKDVNRQVKFSDVSNIGKALDDGCDYISRTTTPLKPVDVEQLI